MNPTNSASGTSMLSGMRNAVDGSGSGLETDIKPIERPIGKRPKVKSPAATFLGTDATPGPASANFGGKTLMGT